MRTLRLFFVCLCVAISIGKADLIPSLIGTSPAGPNTTWSYSIDVPAGYTAQPGDFFTIYDFGSIVPSSNSQPINWTFSMSFTGIDPAMVNAPDNPSILNLTWTYTGPPIDGSSPDALGIGPFQVTTKSSTVANSFFAAQGTLAIGPDAGSKGENVGQVLGPAVPEPSSFLLIIAFGTVGLINRFLRRQWNFDAI